ncbi:Uncharacterised protein [Mycobacteroides abscessus subsp. abscessus]|nr:Uncharacterised protein [Mycobacteroides abscessus subsp. abscessus]
MRGGNLSREALSRLCGAVGEHLLDLRPHRGRIDIGRTGRAVGERLTDRLFLAEVLLEIDQRTVV